MEGVSINYLAVGVAAVSAFIIGGLWYAPFLFGKVWQKEVGLSDEEMKNANMGKTFGIAFVLSLIISYGMASFFTEEVGLAEGAMYGAMTGIFFVAASVGIIYTFEHKSLKLFFIDAGYQIVLYTAVGAIIGVW